MTVRPRKALGQHFLRDASLLARIAAVTGADASHVVLEIGPGPGGLDSEASSSPAAATVVAIERDPRMHCRLVRIAFLAAQQLRVGGGRRARSRLAGARQRRGRYGGEAVDCRGEYSLHTSRHLLLTQALTPLLLAAVTFLVQREVADRIVAAPGSEHYGALSVGVQAVAHTTREFAIARGSFTPVPKVDSAVLHIVPRAAPLVPAEQIVAFRRLVTSLFSYRRKRMLKALREATGLDAAAAATVLDCAGINSDVRPEVVEVLAFEHRCWWRFSFGDHYAGQVQRAAASLLLLGCTHSDAFVVPSIPTLGPYGAGPDVQLTFNVDQNYWPTWTEDGRHPRRPPSMPRPRPCRRIIGVPWSAAVRQAVCAFPWQLWRHRAVCVNHLVEQATWPCAGTAPAGCCSPKRRHRQTLFADLSANHARALVTTSSATPYVRQLSCSRRRKPYQGSNG